MTHKFPDESPDPFWPRILNPHKDLRFTISDIQRHDAAINIVAQTSNALVAGLNLPYSEKDVKEAVEHLSEHGGYITFPSMVATSIRR